VRAEFYRPESPGDVVGSASWTASNISVSAASAPDRPALERIFRHVPVVVDDPSLRSVGTSGPVVLQPGSLRWFQAAARIRGQREGLGVRFVAEEQGAMGWDPAGAYRTFPEAAERRVLVGGAGPRAENGLLAEAMGEGRGSKTSKP
jgi:hypothetical protein